VTMDFAKGKQLPSAASLGLPASEDAGQAASRHN
jgi:hypothetical protein